MEKQTKIRYEIDPHNRLVAARTKKETGVLKFRQVLDGQFCLDKDNALIYHIKKSADFNLPQQIKFSGNLALDKDHNLIFTLDKWNNQCEGNRLMIKGDLIEASSNHLGFSVITKDSAGKDHIYILKISGAWQADKYNRLIFNVEREKGLIDRLTFEGIWQVNRKNGITYTYTKTILKTKEKRTYSLAFKGYWDISEKHRICYILNQELNSRFDFQVSFLKSLPGVLQYQIGIGAIPKRQIITLFGTWRINQRLGVLFEMKYADKLRQSIIFGASYRLDEKSNLDLKLKNSDRRDLGIEIKLSKKVFQEQGEAFIKTLLSRKESAILAGVGFRW